METIFGRIGFIGSGAMAEALMRGLLGRGVPASSIWASDIDSSRLSNLAASLSVNTVEDNAELVSAATTVILAVKPYQVATALEQSGAEIAGRLLISIAAGVTLEQINAIVPPGTPVVRVMPNTPCMIGRGAIAMSPSASCMASHVERARSILASAGTVVTVKEELMDAVTAISGSGPAYVYTFIETMIDAGVRAGLPRDIARILTLETVLGSAEMVKQTGEHPAVLRDKVTSPGGTTVAGLTAMEEKGFRTAVFAGVAAAEARAKELGN